MPQRNIPAHTRCYGLYLPAYTPENMISPVPGALAVIPGEAVPDYARQIVTGDDPAAYFMPDEKLEGTDLTSGLYALRNWDLYSSRVEALAARSELIHGAVGRYEAEIRLLGSLL